MTWWGQHRGARPPNGRARVAGLVGILALGLAAAPAAAQVPRTRADTLEVELRQLRARIDSLRQVVQRLLEQGHRAEAQPAVDELAALRAAARQAAGVTDTTRAHVDTTTRSQDRGGSLSRLNPEISATADIRLQVDPRNPTTDNADVREVELSFQSALDPYAKTKIFLSVGEEGVSAEEAYAYWTGLPLGLRLDLGRFRQQVGELNRWHPHALPESELPLVLREYFGNEGLKGDGLGLYWLAPFGGGAAGTWELWGQATLANNEVLYEGGHRLAGLGHLNIFWQLSPAVFFQIGGTVLGGANPDSSLTSTMYGGDFRLTWRPPARALYHSFTIRGEGYVNRRTLAAVTTDYSGAYLSALYQLSRRLTAGARFDYVEPLAAPGDHTWAIVPTLQWWQSEWVYLRLEWQHQRDALGGGAFGNRDRILIQTVWAIGPHKHETY